ncbi:cation-translocating P-type ATPase [Streptococcus dentapri]|uniref:Cation-translocating P-type ATPase n=1 Tax=Streptococcus dentapri TaxID=573564 RepID=A0ABV8D288_9STRE
MNDEVFNYQSLSSDDLFQKLQTRETGLHSEEFLERQKKYGKNQLETKNQESKIISFLKNFTSLMALLLWIGGLVAILSGTFELGLAIWLVNIINGVFSFVQENRAQNASEALKNMLPSYARVVRDGIEQKILAEDLVPGDILLIEEGDKISADARILLSTDLQVNQSALTGESNPVHKNAKLVTDTDTTALEADNLVFAGTTVANGSARVVVTKIAMKTEFGKIAKLTQTVADDKSPLQKEVDRLTKQISVIAMAVGIFFFLSAIFFVKEPIAQTFIFSLGMIVAFIPEGLLPTITLSLAMAVQRMAKKNALVKKLASVETLGETTVICSDKTGTLTKNEMTIRNIWTPKKEYRLTGLGYAPVGQVLLHGKEARAEQDADLNWILRGATLCSNAHINNPNTDNPNYEVLGDPTEACIEVAAQKAGIDLDDNSLNNYRLKELSFDSDRKRMTTFNHLSNPIDGKSTASFTKGAPQEILELSSRIHDNGSIRPLSDSEKSAILRANDAYAQNGLRVLALSLRLYDDDSDVERATVTDTEVDMIFMGLLVMQDPPREGVEEAVAKCHDAGIQIIMMTGDYDLTAVSIAKSIGIVTTDQPRVISGRILEEMSDQELQEALKGQVIFARIAPEQKFRIVTNLQTLGHVVAVTGDGVNDAPALKKADIGVSMGITGTDVAKESADMILTDDRFTSIVTAIEEGRTIYSNLRKFLSYIFNSNTSEAVPSAFFLFSKGLLPLPLTVMQILAIDLGSDMIPALGLGTEEAEEGVMNRPPRARNDRLINPKLLVKSFLWYGGLEAALAMLAFFFVYVLHGQLNGVLAGSGPVYREATTMTLGAIIFSQIAQVMNCRTKTQSIFKRGFFTNRTINLGIGIEVVLFALLSYLPFLNGLFNTAPINLVEWGILLLCPIIIFLIEEVRKAWLRSRSK